MQSMISHDVADKMHALEDEDMFEYGKVRIAWEHKLNPDLPAFRDQRLFQGGKPASEQPKE